MIDNNKSIAFSEARFWFASHLVICGATPFQGMRNEDAEELQETNSPTNRTRPKV